MTEKLSFKWKIAQKLERLWWKRYLGKQSVEEYRAWKYQYWKKLYSYFSDIVSLKTEHQVADLGCGPAGIFSYFENELTAVDPLLESYEKDLPVFNRADYPNVSFVNSSIEQYSTQKRFHLVCCLNAINHVNDIEVSFNKLFELTAGGGYCLLSIDAHNFQFLKLLFRAIPGDALHPHQYDLKEYKDMAEACGFSMRKEICYKAQYIFNYHVLLLQKS